MIGGHMIGLMNLATTRAQSPFHIDISQGTSAIGGNMNAQSVHIDNSNYVPGQDIIMPAVVQHTETVSAPGGQSNVQMNLSQDDAQKLLGSIFGIFSGKTQSLVALI